MSSRLKTKTGRLSCRVDAALLRWAHWFARSRGTTVTQLVSDYFRALRKQYSEAEDVEQL